jgi:hypothetical protein
MRSKLCSGKWLANFKATRLFYTIVDAHGVRPRPMHTIVERALIGAQLVQPDAWLTPPRALFGRLDRNPN